MSYSSETQDKGCPGLVLRPFACTSCAAAKDLKRRADRTVCVNILGCWMVDGHRLMGGQAAPVSDPSIAPETVGGCLILA